MTLFLPVITYFKTDNSLINTVCDDQYNVAFKNQETSDSDVAFAKYMTFKV